MEFYTQLYFQQIFAYSFIWKTTAQILNALTNDSSVCDKESI